MNKLTNLIGSFIVAIGGYMNDVTELAESIMKITHNLLVNTLDSINMTIDEQKTDAKVSNGVDRESFNLGLSCAMDIVDMFKKEVEKLSVEEGGKE